jgi:hypothetical protein
LNAAQVFSREAADDASSVLHPGIQLHQRPGPDRRWRSCHLNGGFALAKPARR